MNKILNIDFSLSELVKDIQNGKYCLPKFQRDFVWKSSDITSLADSLIRGYPISSMLSMPTTGTLKVSAEPLRTDGARFNKDSSNYLLDGQQRMTSITKIFLDMDNDKQYFFDLLTILNEEYPEDKLTERDFYFEYWKKHKLTEDYCRYFNIGNNGYVTDKVRCRYISGRSVIENRYGSIINKFLRNFEGICDDDIDKYTNFLNAICGAIGSYGVPFSTLSADADLGVVCRVFEKVNSTGKKLTTFDLINAKSFESKIPRYQKGLSDYITKDLIALCESSSSIKKAINEVFEFNNKTFVNLGRIARIIGLTELLQQAQVPALTNTILLSKSADYWFEGWEKNKDILLKAYIHFYSSGIYFIAPASYFEYMCAVVCANPKSIYSHEFMSIIEKHALKIGIENTQFTKSDLDVVCKFNTLIKEHLENPTVCISKSIYIPKIGINPNNIDFDMIRKKSRPYLAIMHIMTRINFDNKFLVDIYNNKLNSNEHVIYHLLIPHEFKNTNKHILNSISNYVPISIDSSKIKSKDITFEEYYTKITSLYCENTINNIFENNLIPLEYINNHGSINNEAFLKARSALIQAYVISFFNQ